MKRFYLIVISLFILSICFTVNLKTTAQSETYQAPLAPEVSPNIVVSQFFGGGGLSGAPYTNDFVELFNRGSAPVSLNGWSTQYASSGGTNWLVTPLTNVTLQPGQYYLIQYASNGSAGSALPAPDMLAPSVTSNGSTFIPNLSSTSGKLALVNSTAQLTASTCPTDSTIVDLIGYGSGASCFEGAKTPDLSVSTAGKRNGSGCTDTDNNSSDFTIVSPAPRNTGSLTNSCNLGGNLQASAGANPNTVAPGATTLLTVTVFPATTPSSTGISVVGNLTNIGGGANQQFFDDATNGDATAGDNIFSYLATIPVGTSGGVHNITATASDAQSRSANVAINITINAPVTGGEDYLLLGNPSNATADVANENNYLMIKPQYALSYNRSRAIPNWVSWRLDTSWIGTAPRQDDFRPDPALPAGWYQVTDGSYSGSGFDRGHHTPSGDRTRSVPDNSATFLMTNIMPQAGGNNQGPWNDLEGYCRTLATQGKELYIIAGGTGVGGVGSSGSTVNTIDNGRITVPAQTWKVILVLPNSDNDLSRIDNNTRTIAVIMPNIESIRANNWEQFITSVDQVETLTGYDFFSNVSTQIQSVIESRVDGQANATPTITAASGVSRQQGNPASNSQIATVNDNNQTENTLSITVNGGTSATVNGVTVSNIAVDAAGVVSANVVAAPGATAAGFTLRVTDNQTAFTEATFNVAVTSGSYEADVNPRPNQAGNPVPGKSGDDTVTSGDVTQIRRFALGLDTPDTVATNEFQKADCAPIQDASNNFVYGDGVIASGDVTQARRLALGLDTLRLAAGPTNAGGSFADRLINQKTIAGFGGGGDSSIASRQTVTPVTVNRIGNVLTVGIVMNTNIGATLASSLSFTLNFNAAELSNPTNVRLGSGDDSAALGINDLQADSGRLGVLMDLSPTQTFGAASQQLVLIDFTVAAGAPATTDLGFSDSLTARFIADSNGDRLDNADSFVNAAVSIGSPTPKSRKRMRLN